MKEMGFENFNVGVEPEFYLFKQDEKGNPIIAYSTCLTKDGVLFGSKDKVYFYSYRDSSLRLLQKLNKGNNFNISLLSLWNEHTVLCCSRWQGLALLDLKTGKHRLSIAERKS